MAVTTDHEIVSIYPFSDDEIDEMMAKSMECVLMWATKDGWPVGVTHAFVWHDGKIWITFASHRHRASAIRRDGRVSVNVSSQGYAEGVEGPGGAITFKGTGEFFDDDETKMWFYQQLAAKLNPGDAAGEKYWVDFLNSPLRTVLAVTPVKKIMYNGTVASKHMAGTATEDELGDRLETDSVRMNRKREKKGILLQKK